MRRFIFILLCFALPGCNSIYLKPHTLDTDALIYAPRGGYSMSRSVKEVMENRGYDVNIGKLVRVSEVTGGEAYSIPKDAKYAVNVSERREVLRPLWCMFNGFWWWNFNVSIIDRTNNDEILSWRGRGCANSSIHKLNDIFDALESDVRSTKSNKKIDIEDKDSEIVDHIIIATTENSEQ